MHPAYSVLFFTTASGAGYGMLALLGLVGFNHGQASSLWFGLVSMAIALGLITAGLLSSTLHLGRPERAWRAISQWRSSWLSREGVAAILTYIPSALFGLVWSGLYEAPGLIAPLGIITSIMCVVTVFSTGKIYSTLNTIRAWNQPLTVPVYLAFGLATGAAILMAVAASFGRFQLVQLIIASVSLVLIAVLKFLYWNAIDNAPRDRTMAKATGLGDGVRQWEVPHTATNFLQKEMGYVIARKHAKSLRALMFVMLVMVGALYGLTLVSPWFAIPAAFVILAAAFTERWLFFAEGEHVVTLFYGNQQV
jgi:DMSO reductase anchor subunit